MKDYNKIMQEVRNNNVLLKAKQGKKIPVKFLDCTDHKWVWIDESDYMVCKWCGKVSNMRDEIDMGDDSGDLQW